MTPRLAVLMDSLQAAGFEVAPEDVETLAAIDWQSLCEVPSPDAGWGLRPVKGMCRPLPGNPGAWWCCGPEVDGG